MSTNLITKMPKDLLSYKILPYLDIFDIITLLKCIPECQNVYSKHIKQTGYSIDTKFMFDKDLENSIVKNDWFDYCTVMHLSHNSDYVPKSKIPFKLPKYLKQLTIGKYWKSELTFPANLTHLSINTDYNLNVDLCKICPHLRHLKLPSGFNREIILPKGLISLNMGCKFNWSIKLPDTLQQLIMSCHFNQNLQLPKQLKTLIMGVHFNRNIILPDKLEHLVLSHFFDQPLLLPNKLRFLSIGTFQEQTNDGYSQNMIESLFNHPVRLPEGLLTLMVIKYSQNISTNQIKWNSLPSSLQKLVVDERILAREDVNFSENLKTLSCLPTWKRPGDNPMKAQNTQKLQYLANLQFLVMDSSFNDATIALPQNLSTFVMGDSFDQNIDLPKDLKQLHMGKSFNKSIELPFGLTHLTMSEKFDQDIILPPSLIYLKMGQDFYKHLLLPNKLESLELNVKYNLPIELSNSMKVFRMGENFDQNIALPNSLIDLCLGQNFDQPIHLPCNLKNITIKNRSYSHNLILPRSIDCVTSEALPSGIQFQPHDNVLNLVNLISSVSQTTMRVSKTGVKLLQDTKYNHTQNGLPENGCSNCTSDFGQSLL